MSATPGSGEHTGPLGVRRSVELPEADMDAADRLAPAASPGTERDGGEKRAAGAGDDADANADEPSEEPSGKTSADGKRTERNAEEKRTEEKADPLARAASGAVAPPSASGRGAVDGMPPDRPKKPVLAAVAIGGAVVLAIPILLIGTGAHHGKKHRSAAAAATVLPGDGQQPPPGAYVSTSPSASATPTPSPRPKHTPKASKSATPAHSVKPVHHAVAKSHGIPASERPAKGGNPYALELHSPYDLNPGKTLRTNRVALTMESGGDLVLRDTSARAIWSSGTHHAGAYAEFQTDGNLVVYINGRQPIWASGTVGHDDATLVLQADDNMVIFQKGGGPIWATGTNR